MSWNYRILAVEEDKDEINLTIHEVYYKDIEGKQIPELYTASPAEVWGDSVGEIAKVLEMMKEALQKPILYEGKRFPEEFKEK